MSPGTGDFLFGMDKGIYRYDGMSWHLFPFDEGMVGTQINALYVARDGSVCVGSDRGISRFENGTWERVFPSQGDYGWNTWDLMEAQDGSLWASTEWGALRLTPDGASLYVSAEDTTGIREMVSDVVTFVAVPGRVLPGRPDQRFMVYDVCEAPNGAIWFGYLTSFADLRSAGRGRVRLASGPGCLSACTAQAGALSSATMTGVLSRK